LAVVVVGLLTFVLRGIFMVPLSYW